MKELRNTYQGFYRTESTDHKKIRQDLFTALNPTQHDKTKV